MMLKIKKGDTLPRVRERLEVESELEGATVYFRMEADDGTVLVDSEASIDDVESGEVSYQFSSGETDRVGSHQAEWFVERDNGRETYPLDGYREIEILDSLDRDEQPVTGSS